MTVHGRRVYETDEFGQTIMNPCLSSFTPVFFTLSVLSLLKMFRSLLVYLHVVILNP